MTAEARTFALRRVAFIESRLPRQCGIATCTADLCDAVASACPGVRICQVAVTDTEAGAADTCIAMAYTRVSSLLAWLDQNSEPT